MDVCGRYEVVSALARGGMARIDLARERGGDRLVAIKRVRLELAENAEVVEMFLEEARLAATLRHPNLPEIHEVGGHGAASYVAMEYLRGKDLRAILDATRRRAGGVPIDHALAITCSVSAALHHAHGMRLVHRDVSPRNVFVTYDGAVKLLDFGIAKSSGQRRQTATGTVKGSVSYMAPEQIRGEALDPRTDVFAVAAILWELLTGELLFTGATDYDIMHRIVSDPAPPPSSVRACPPELEAIVMRGLARVPGDRYPSAEALRVALRAQRGPSEHEPRELARFMREVFDEAPPHPAVIPHREPREDRRATRRVTPRAPRRRWPWIALAGGTTLAVGTWLATRPVAPPPARAPELAPARSPSTVSTSARPPVAAPPIATPEPATTSAVFRSAPPSSAKRSVADTVPTPAPAPLPQVPLSEDELDAVLPPR